MHSQTKEDYLKAMLYLADEKGRFNLKDLSSKLEVSNPTANNMVKKLQDLGWVRYEKYKPLKLTRKGRKQAGLILRKHRLTEMYLHEVMGFGWEEVHDIAEELEHVNSEKLFDRMDRIMGFPAIDPHGSPIPDKEGNIHEEEYKKLSELNSGARAKLCAIDDSTQDLLVFLNDKNIMLNMEFTVKEIHDFDKSMVVDYGDCENVVLSNTVTERLMVEQI